MLSSAGMSWTRALSASEIRDKGRALFRHGKHQIVLFSAGDAIRAIDNRCPHEGYPLIQGSLDPPGCLLTCQWHNWKFDLATGECVLGEDHVRSYPVRIENGEVHLDLSEPSVETIEARALEGLEGALDDRQYGRLAREISRLLVNGIDPVIAVRTAVARTHDRLEYGTTHAYAATADWLTLYRSLEEVERKVVCLTEACDHMADDALRQPVFPFTDSIRDFDGEAFLSAVESEDEPAAVSLVRGAMSEGKDWDTLEPWLARAAYDHYNDFGHAAIYVHKTGELLDHIGHDALPELLLPVTRMLCYTTRDDLLPDFRAYGESLERLPSSLGTETARIETSPFAKNIADALDWTLARMETHAPAAVYSGLLEASALNLLAFDERHAVAARRSVSQNVSWLGFTHAFTFANASRHLAEKYPELWPKALLQMACFVGRVKRFLSAEPELDRWAVDDTEAFFDRAVGRVLDHGLGEPIFSSHLLKTTMAVRDELPHVAPETAGHMMAALNRFLSASIKQKHPLRTARQALALVAR